MKFYKNRVTGWATDTGDGQINWHSLPTACSKLYHTHTTLTY